MKFFIAVLFIVFLICLCLFIAFRTVNSDKSTNVFDEKMKDYERKLRNYESKTKNYAKKAKASQPSRTQDNGQGLNDAILATTILSSNDSQEQSVSRSSRYSQSYDDDSTRYSSTHSSGFGSSSSDSGSCSSSSSSSCDSGGM